MKFSINQKDEFGNSILFIAIKKLNIEIVAYLLEKGADVNEKYTVYSDVSYPTSIRYNILPLEKYGAKT